MNVSHVKRLKHLRVGQSGFSLLELLVCVAIIGILMAIYSSTLTKAMRAAKGVAAGEAMHQTQIARMASEDEASDDPPTLEEGRDAYRQVLDTGKGEAIMTEVLFILRTELEYKAYWRTLIDPEIEEEPGYTKDGWLIAFAGSGAEYRLRPIGSNDGQGAHVVAWEFFSTDLSETSTGTLGSNVMYSDGSIRFVKYPGVFPMTAAVAKFSHKFVELSDD